MNKIILLLISFALFSCQGKEAAYLNNKIVYDNNGCQFFIRENIGDNVFARHIKDDDCQELK